MRNKYIRFFISSTFSDMEKERNLLQQVLDKLANEYSQQGWQIEAVDLRWGISDEAGLDNKTMQICLSELKRCQELSPKPNFIVLLGNRYGWIPLPENIFPKDANLIKYNFSITKKEKDLFDTWYKLDKNVIPNGMYILQRRTGRFIEKEVWQKEVEGPLSDVFYKVVYGSQIIKRSIFGKLAAKLFRRRAHCASNLFFGLSATELEIQHGALSVDDAKEHVVAYFRDILDLENLSSDNQEKYGETGRYYLDNLEKLSALRTALKEKISKSNELDLKIFWKEYQQDSFSEIFKRGMEQHLRHVIEKSIKEAAKEIIDTENQTHLRYAQQNFSNIIGRKKELAYIDAFINSSTDNNPKWIKAKSGTGKSALMAHVANSYKDSHYVICRFCGFTQKTARAESLISSIIDDFYEISKLSVRLEFIADYIKMLNTDRPVLLIIDALDQVVDGNFYSLDWLFPFEEDNEGNRRDINFPQNVKVILSSLETVECTNKKHNIDILHLNNMDIYSFDLAYSKVKQANRMLSSIERIALQQTIERSDKSALYLCVLGRYLSKNNDNEDFSTLPTDTNGVVSKILDDLEKPEKHGTIVKEVLSLLAIEELTDKEILTLLAKNKTFYQQFKSASHHEWNDHGYPYVPPILWSRLKHEVQPFIRDHITNYGVTNVYFHNEIKEIIKNRYLKNIDYRFYYGLLYQHFKKTLPYDMHALSKLIHCGCLYAGYSFDDKDLYDKTCDEIHSYMFDKNLIKRKIEQKSEDLQSDIIDVLKYTKGQSKDYLELLQVSDMKMLPSWNFFRNIVDERNLLSTMMEDSLANSQLNSLLHIIPSLLDNYYKYINITCVCLSNNGEIVAYIKDGKEVILEDVTNPSKLKSYSWGESIIELQCSDDMHYLAIREKNRCFKFDTANENIIESYPLFTEGWMSLSRTGSIICEGNKQQDMQHAMWSISGNIVWAICKNGTLRRYDHNLSSYYEFYIELAHDDGNVNNPLDTNEYAICACSDNICISANNNSFILLRWYEETDEYKYCIHHLSRYKKIKLLDDIFKISPDEHFMLFYNNDSHNCIKYLIHDEKGLVMQDEFCSSISCINNNVTKYVEYSYVNDINIEFQKYNSLIQVRADGVKNITANNYGTIIGVLSQTHWDSNKFMKLIYNHKQIKWYPPFTTNDYYKISTVSVAPNGKYIAVSTFNKDQFAIFYLDVGSTALINSPKFKNDTAFTVIDQSYFEISISEDSKYIVAAENERISILSKAGKIIATYDKVLVGIDNKIRISTNNRYMYFRDLCIDLVTEKTQKIEIEIDICVLFSGNTDIVPLNIIYPDPNILLHSHGFITIDTMANRCLTKEKQIVACSRTGRYLFYLQDHSLFLYSYFTNKLEMLFSSVICVIPAFDENHIFIIFEERKKNGKTMPYSLNTIWLYNIKKRKIEQKGQISEIAFALICAKGLVVANQFGATHLFSPSPQFHVNIPAVTTFVRRWNLETKQQEEPTAVCPMCGGIIDISPDIQTILTNNPSNRKFEDWDNPKLFGHYCPHCNAELRFNPYIV